MSPVHALFFLTLLFSQFSYAWDTAGESSYSFIVAGHTYGKPGIEKTGFHPPFKNSFGFIKSLDNIELGFLTGDIVWRSTRKSWDAIDAEILELGIPMFFAPGNHDLANRRLYLERYGRNGKSYYSFPYQNDLFIVLDPNIDGWDISGEQLEFLKLNLAKNYQYRNIFIFTHQLIWWDSRASFKSIELNSFSGRKPRSNFWPEVAPLLTGISNNIYIFSGDVGAFEKHMPVYLRHGNIRLIASGMGGGRNDNLLVVTRRYNTDADVDINIKWLANDKFTPFVAESVPTKLPPLYPIEIDKLLNRRATNPNTIAFIVDPQNPKITLPGLRKAKLRGGKKAFKLVIESGQASIILKPVNFRANHQSYFHIVAESPSDAVMRLYYKTRSSNNYGEQAPYKIPLTIGHNDIYLELEIDEPENILRLDPRLKQGELVISTLEVFMFEN